MLSSSCMPMQQFGRKEGCSVLEALLLNTQRAHLRLLEAVKLPAKLAVIHCKGHQKGQEEEAQGNREADQEAKRATRGANPVTAICPPFPKKTLALDYTPEEHSQYAEQGWEIGSHGWFQTDQPQIILSDSQVWKITISLHKSTHFGRDNLKTLLKPILYPPQLAKVVRSHRILIPV